MSLFARLRSWLALRRGRNVSLPRALLLQAPRRALRLVTEEASRHHLAGRELAWGERLRAEIAGVRGRPFFLIAVPDTRHTVLPCMALACRRVDLVVIGNGLRAWEEDLVRRAGGRYIALPALRRAVVPHGVVLRVLLEQAGRPFGLHDPDLYVFRPGLYEELEPGEGEAVTGVYGFTNAPAALTLPTTHLLALDAPVLLGVCRKYAVTPEVYRRTPAHLKDLLAAMGIGDHNRPKSYLTFYDTFTLVWLLAVQEGYKLRVLTSLDDPDVFHIGGMSYDRDNPRLRYAHARFLTLPTAAPLVDRYWPRLVGKKTRRELERAVPPGGGAFDVGIDRLAAALDGDGGVT